MQATAVIAVEGVLKKPVTGHATDTGHRLYRGLAETHRIVLVTEDDNRDRTAEWLLTQGFARHDHIVYGDTPSPTGTAWWAHIVRTLKLAYGFDVDFTVVPDPVAARSLIAAGLTAVLFTPAAYSLPEWRPDHPSGVTPWNDLEAEMRVQRQLRAKDDRWTQEELF